MPSIRDARARKVLDSRGNPTIEVELSADGATGRMSAPSGASTGLHEVDAFPAGGVDVALTVFRNRVRAELLGIDPADQKKVDETLHAIDRSPRFSSIGGNLSVAVSIAAAKLAAALEGAPLFRYLGRGGRPRMPDPMGNVIGGGRHAIGGTTIQEFLSVAQGPTAAASVLANAEVHHTVRDRLMSLLPRSPLGRGDEGAWIAPLPDEQALAVLRDACAEVSKACGFPVRPALDLAASEFYRDRAYHDRDARRTPKQQIDFVEDLVQRFDLVSVEDPLEQEDFAGWADLTRRIGKRCMVIGDDLFATNVARLRRGIEDRAANAILIKPNQIGTLSDTEAAVDLAHAKGYRTVMSHRSGETTDDAIAHLAVAFGCAAIKTGAVGGERVAKLNELIRIEEQLSEA